MRISDWSSDVCSSDLTVDEPRQDIAADGVGAEHEFPASALHQYRRCQEVLAELLDRRVRRHQVGEEGEQHQDADDDQAGDGTELGSAAWTARVRPDVYISGDAGSKKNKQNIKN